LITLKCTKGIVIIRPVLVTLHEEKKITITHFVSSLLIAQVVGTKDMGKRSKSGANL